MCDAIVTGHSVFDVLPVVSNDTCATLCMVTNCEISVQDFWEIQAHIVFVNTEFVMPLVIL